MRVLEVASSWGADGNPKYSGGGVRTAKWIYVLGTGRWGELLSNNTMQWSDTAGPYNHIVVGIYRSTAPITLP